MKDLIKHDMQANGLDPASFADFAKAYFLRPDFKLVVLYRLYAAWHGQEGIKHIASGMLWRHAIRRSGCYISPLAKIGGGLKLCHATGIVIGRGAVIGENATIYQHVTLGQKDEIADEFPTIGNDVLLYAGACVLGNVTIGDKAVIGANAVVLKDVQAEKTAVGTPARTL